MIDQIRKIEAEAKKMITAAREHAEQRIRDTKDKIASDEEKLKAKLAEDEKQAISEAERKAENEADKILKDAYSKISKKKSDDKKIIDHLAQNLLKNIS